MYEASLADVGDRNPYAGRSLVLAKLWMCGYRRMLHVRVNSGPAMQKYLAAREERKYLLPQALAVNIKHLQPMYQRYLDSRT